MKQILTFLTIVGISAAICFAQSKSNSTIAKQIKDSNGEKTFALEYNEAGNATKLMFFGEDFGRAQYESAGIKSLTFGVMFFYAGKNLEAAPDDVALTFWVEAKKPKFAEAHRVTIKTDTETLDLGEARYAVKAGENREFLNFRIPFETLKKLGQTAAATLKVGNYELKFTPEHLKRFADFVKISDPKNM